MHEIREYALESPTLARPGRICAHIEFHNAGTFQVLNPPGTVKITDDQQRQGRRPAREQIHPGQKTGRLALKKAQLR